MSEREPTPTVYPALSTTSDLPTGPVAEVEPLAGQTPDPEPAVTAEVDAASDPAVDPEKPAKPRGRPSNADRKLAAMEAEIERLKALFADKPAVAEPPKPDPAPTLVRPKRADFADPDAYEDALMEYAAERAAQKAVSETEAQRTKREAEERDKAAKTTEAQQNERLVSAWNARRQEAAGRYEDYEEVAESPDTPMSVPMLHAIVNSKFGPDIAYWLGQHREKAAQIAAMTNPVRQALEIGRIEARVRRALAGEKPAAVPAAEPVVEPPQRSALPRPLRTVRPQSQPVDEAPTEANSQDRIGKMVEELRKGNAPLAWGQPAGRA